MYTGFSDLNVDSFLAGAEDEYREMSIVLGIVGINRDEFSRWNPDYNRGTAIFDQTDGNSSTVFDLRTRGAQNALKKLCEEIREVECDLEACVGGFNRLVKPDTLYCLIEEFDDWCVAAQLGGSPRP